MCSFPLFLISKSLAGHENLSFKRINNICLYSASNLTIKQSFVTSILSSECSAEAYFWVWGSQSVLWG